MQKLWDGDIGQRRVRRSPHVGLIILGGDGFTCRDSLGIPARNLRRLAFAQDRHVHPPVHLSPVTALLKGVGGLIDFHFSIICTNQHHLNWQLEWNHYRSLGSSR